MSNLHVITPPSELPVSLEEAAAYLKAEEEDNAVVERLVASVTDWVAGAHGWLGRSLVPWTLELRQPIPGGRHTPVLLPRPPFIEVEAVSYTDNEGAEQTLESSAYEVTVWADGLAWLGLTGGETWPAGSELRVRYRAGYEAGSPPEPNVPDGLRQAILAVVARLYEFREEGLPARDDAFVQRLFAPYRVYL